MHGKDFKTLKKLERAFWGLWFLAPLVLAFVIHDIWTSPYVVDKSSSSGPIFVHQLSLAGQTLVIIEILFAVSVYASIMVLMHSLIHRFTKSDGLVTSTLKTMNRIAILIGGFAVMEIILYNCNLYFMYRIGDLPSWQPAIYIELIYLAFSLILFSLRILIKEAVSLREDADLTI